MSNQRFRSCQVDRRNRLNGTSGQSKVVAGTQRSAAVDASSSEADESQCHCQQGTEAQAQVQKPNFGNQAPGAAQSISNIDWQSGTHPRTTWTGPLPLIVTIRLPPFAIPPTGSRSSQNLAPALATPDFSRDRELEEPDAERRIMYGKSPPLRPWHYSSILTFGKDL